MSDTENPTPATTPSPTTADIITRLVEESSGELRATLAALGAAGEPVYEQAKQLAILTIQVHTAKLNGENTDVAEKSLKAIMLNLKSASGIVVATEAINFAQAMLAKLSKATLDILTALL